ncbi:MAG: elongation factor G [Bacillota bacterium]|nr:elongation factor G [Bacillota bacterium]
MTRSVPCNLALVGHSGSGKTTLAESVLALAGAVGRRGRVEDGNATLDFEPEEVQRKISLFTGFATLRWHDQPLTLLDAPGYFDFAAESLAALRGADAAALVVDASAGPQVGGVQAWDRAGEAGLARFVLVNKMDRERAHFDGALEPLRSLAGSRLVPLTLPVGAESGFRGVLDVLSGQAWGRAGGRRVEIEAPPELLEQAAGYRQQLFELAAEQDEAMLERYLEAGELSPEELERGLVAAVRAGDLVPAFALSATSDLGVEEALEQILRLAPEPAARSRALAVSGPGGATAELSGDPGAPLCAQVIKTQTDPYVGRLSVLRIFQGTLRADSQVWNVNREAAERVAQIFVLKGKEQQAVASATAGSIVALAKLAVTQTGDTLTTPEARLQVPPLPVPEPVYTMAVQPKARGDEDKVSAGLARLLEEDPSLRVERNHETHQVLVSGMGDVHLEVLRDRLRRKFQVEVELVEPRVAFRETIRKHARAEGKHKKQTGGHGQYGHVFLQIDPLPEAEFDFVDKIFGGAVPRQYIPAVEKGVRETMAEGVLAGYPVTHVRVTLDDGSYHPVDSSEMAFKIAASLAFKKAFHEADPVLLEPVDEVTVVVPEEYLGDVLGDLNRRRGRVLGMERDGEHQVVRAEVPETEMLRYAVDLRSMTRGWGRFRQRFVRYEEMPSHIAQQVIERSRQLSGVAAE